MKFGLDQRSINAIFDVPGNDGSYPPEGLAYLQDLSSKRPCVFLAFAPKAAGTFLRQAAIDAVGGDLVRVVYAQGGRDGQPYLPTFIAYHRGGICPGPLVTHIHMQALPANQRFMEALNIRPVIMIRNIPDMLASYWDMLEADPAARRDGLNCEIPENFPSLSKEQKSDFLVDILAPWYASYYSTWLGYAVAQPDRICILAYSDLQSDAAGTLEKVLEHSRLPRLRRECEAAVESAWSDRGNLRFNKGTEGRGQRYFSSEQIERLARLLAHYPGIGAHKDVLLPRT